jgi:predicted transcriptional regulator of viral defense system
MIEKKVIPNSYLIEKNVNSGVILVSSPELTAVDLLLYPRRAGGISHIATVLSELAESLDFSKVEKNFFDRIPPAVVQRLGFILDEVLEEEESSGMLFDKALSAGVSFRKVPLVSTSNEERAVSSSQKLHASFSKKWKIEINYNVEADV